MTLRIKKIFHGNWDVKMTHEQYLGLEERLKDCRYVNCRSRRAFSAKDGEPYPGTCMPYMPSLAWKILEYMSSSHDPRYRKIDYYLQKWYKNVSRIANKLLRGHGWQQERILWRESDGLSVRWSALCEAIEKTDITENIHRTPK